MIYWLQVEFYNKFYQLKKITLYIMKIQKFYITLTKYIKINYKEFLIILIKTLMVILLLPNIGVKY
jgi:hypothetical protein